MGTIADKERKGQQKIEKAFSGTKTQTKKESIVIIIRSVKEIDRQMGLKVKERLNRGSK